MKIYKLSLGTDFFNDTKFEILKKEKLISIYPGTKAKGQSKVSQGDMFLGAKKGDIFYVCRSNHSIEFIGMFSEERPLYSDIEGQNDWTDRSYILLFEAKSPKAYNNELDKWWAPKNNSTFIEIPNHENNLFEKEILQPVFNISINAVKNFRNIKLEKINHKMEYYIALQLTFNKLMNDEVFLLKKVNALTNVELKKIEYTYLKRGDISKQPVVLLRSKLLELLINGDQLNGTIISQVKQDLNASFDKNVYQAWSSNFRILYTFLYDKDKSDLETYFKKLINQLQKDLEIENETKIKLVHFDGAQNQGQDRLWFAIYNKVNKSQKLAKQLFFEINNGLKYGLLNHGDLSLNKLKESDKFDYQELLNTFKLFKEDIVNDNSMEKARLSEYIDILNYKKQIILQGPPGTGKTYTAKDLSEQFILNTISSNKKVQKQNLEDSGRFSLVQFHPSYSYEDFVRGITVKNNNGILEYVTENKPLAKFAKKALESDLPHVLIIDEINRANLPVVLGELIYGLEYRGEAVETMYSIDNDNTITIPENLYIIGTMNTADRSVGHIDYAIKRRFAFVDILPNEEPIKNHKAKKLFQLVSKLFVEEKEPKKGNSRFLASDFNYNDVQLGHSYFILKEGTEEEQLEELKLRLKYEILPILNEYTKDGLLLESEELSIKLEEIENFEF